MVDVLLFLLWLIVGPALMLVFIAAFTVFFNYDSDGMPRKYKEEDE